MIIKIIFSIVIVFVSTIIGEIYANGYRQRTKMISQLISTLQMLETEIVYASTPLPFLMQKVSRRSPPEIANLLETTSEILLRKEGYTFSEAWQKGIELSHKNSALYKEDLALLINLGNNLGNSDRDNQMKHIQLAMEELRRNYDEAIHLQNKNVKLYKSMGLLGGLAIVIILF
ncbi:stage III sporulation protein SpoIIIAB [Alkaliphilus hydrothermalis]|uniref:Stage III sporulation protein AB n=1 Tax=Alkaliphilus hydrothermalis TaxID=1482730 RepID=A0ABS2NM32_9FIRM|nr:stage III sporulation protein SpoIIIAB [Alkaliphilus hydrothermalis]MBM7613996.1 stage III sporulation protein AB [Alkaliphilus hydrothermalis]